MNKEVAGFVIAPLWNEFMQKALEVTPAGNFTEPEPNNAEKPILRGQWQINQSTINSRNTNNVISNLLNRESEDNEDEEDEQEEPPQQYSQRAHSILHWVNKENPRGPIPQNPGQDGQYRYWEYPVRQWLESRAPSSNTQEGVNSNSQIQFKSPEIGQVYRNDDTVTVEITSPDELELEQAEYFLNGISLGSVDNKPAFKILLKPEDIDSTREGANILQIIAQDEDDNTYQSLTTFRIED